MPRVLLTGFCAVPGPRRAGVQLRHVIRALTSMHSVDLLVSREGEQAYVERQGSVRVLRVPTHEADLRAQIQSFQRALKRQLDGADYDVVHCRDSWSGLPVLDARARLGYAVVYDLTRAAHGDSLDPELDAQYGRDEEACILAADMVLAPTQAAVKALQNRGKPERVMLSPPGVDVDRFDWDDAPRSGPPKILYTGQIDPGRGVRVLVRAMVAIIKEVDCRLVLAGPLAPKFEQSLRDALRELSLTDKVDVLGAVDHDQLPTLIASSTVCVVPAAPDLTPNPAVVYPTKLLEYMACRRAVVAPRRETVQMVVDNGREALLFEPGDPIDLAKKVLRLLGEPLLRERVAAAAYERVRKDFTASNTRRLLRNAYNVLQARFAGQFSDEPGDDSPKVELLSDDDFEATVFEEPAEPGHAVDTAVHNVPSIEADVDNDSAEAIVPPPPYEQTMERRPVAAAANPTLPVAVARDSGAWIRSQTSPPPAGPDDWVVTNVAQAARGIDSPSDDSGENTATGGGADDGTPIEGSPSAPPVVESSFVAGEIDVPTGDRSTDGSASVDFTAAGGLLGTPSAEKDPDTGNFTPPLERR
jgi:glycosyltransferase involved in cell wall biosynthesis